jgi:uncharacterized protein with von Willebrand factor type A (vWA) domain
LFASDLERRVLGHLPAWTADEEAYQQAEVDAGASESIRGYTLGALTARLLEDKTIPARTEDQVAAFLDALVEKGYASTADGEWRMTEAGLRALGEPTLAEHEQTPGPVQIGTGG